MLDDNLPTFFLKPAGSGINHHRDFYLSYHGSEAGPAYHLQHIDPAATSPSRKNCYAAALFDAFNPDVLFGEVLARPAWTQPTLNQEEVRKNGGVPPPPQPILPNDFTVQLYGPDQQIRVELKEGKWGASDSYEFSMPVSTFRTPSGSHLDRGQSDPASLAITPKVHFVWRKEGKLSKDLTCFMTGRSTDAHEKKKSRRDPDIAVALWRSMRELTVYEPNLSRVEMEDPKGLEVVLLLSAVVIKDLYFASKEHVREMFNVSEIIEERKLSGGGRKLSNPQQTFSIHGRENPLGTLGPVQGSVQRPPPLNDAKRHHLPKLQTFETPSPGSRRDQTLLQQMPPPMADPRMQWELDAETARLKAQAEMEEREAALQRQRRLKAKEKSDEAERKRLLKIVEGEEKEARRRQAQIDKETERLQHLYGLQQPILTQANSGSSRQRASLAQVNPTPPPRPTFGNGGLYIQPSAAVASNAMMMSGANLNDNMLQISRPAKKKSFFGLRSVSDEGGETSRLKKKNSVMW